MVTPVFSHGIHVIFLLVLMFERMRWENGVVEAV